MEEVWLGLASLQDSGASPLPSPASRIARARCDSMCALGMAGASTHKSLARRASQTSRRRSL
eukprot:11774757-Alexandrium_andersonii.AAC.1